MVRLCTGTLFWLRLALATHTSPECSTPALHTTHQISVPNSGHTRFNYVFHQDFINPPPMKLPPPPNLSHVHPAHRLNHPVPTPLSQEPAALPCCNGAICCSAAAVPQSVGAGGPSLTPAWLLVSKALCPKREGSATPGLWSLGHSFPSLWSCLAVVMLHQGRKVGRPQCNRETR